MTYHLVAADDTGLGAVTAVTEPTGAFSSNFSPAFLAPHQDGSFVYASQWEDPVTFVTYCAFWVARVTGTTVTYGTRFTLSGDYSYLYDVTAVGNGRLAVLALNIDGPGDGGYSVELLTLDIAVDDTITVSGSGYFVAAHGNTDGEGALHSDHGGALLPVSATQAVFVQTYYDDVTAAVVGFHADLIDLTADPIARTARHEIADADITPPTIRNTHVPTDGVVRLAYTPTATTVNLLQLTVAGTELTVLDTPWETGEAYTPPVSWNLFPDLLQGMGDKTAGGVSATASYSVSLTVVPNLTGAIRATRAALAPV